MQIHIHAYKHTHTHWSDRKRTTTNQSVLFLTPSKLSRSTSGWTIPNSVWWTTVQRVKYNPSITPQFFKRVMWLLYQNHHILLLHLHSNQPRNEWCGVCPVASTSHWWHAALSPAMPDVASVPESLWHTELLAQQCLMWHLSQKVLLWHAALSPAMTDVASVPESLWHTELGPAVPDVASIPESPAVVCSTEPSNDWCGIYPRKSCHWHTAPSTWSCGICIQSPQQGTSSPASPTGGLCWWTKTEPLEADICILTGPQPWVASTPANPTNCTYEWTKVKAL